jgi:alanine racemase
MMPPSASRPTWAEISLPNLASNLRTFHQASGPSLKVFAMVKADAYGHGAPAVANELARRGVGTFGVATLEEGLVLRNSGIKGEILLLGPLEKDWLPEAVKSGLGLSGWSRPFLDHAEKTAARLRKKVAVHLKVDTGMSRLGFDGVEAAEVLALFARRAWPHLALASGYTHLACAGETTDRYSPGQLGRFLALPWPRGLRLHAGNSAGSLRHDQSSFSAVRPGIFLYGIMQGRFHPAAARQKPVLSFKTKIASLRDLAPGRSVSYGATYTTRRRARLATLPAGYADGVPRFLSNRASVLIRGKRCPVRGRICMDLFMVDVTALPSVAAGEEAVLIGSQAGQEIRAEEWADLGDTITYEITCGISSRVPRRVIHA